MESLLRKVRKNPQNVKATKHSKLGEGWDENREAITEGVTFYLKYLGSTLLEELPLGQSYGEGISFKSVQSIVNMAKTAGKQLIKVSLKVSPYGIQVADMESKEMLIDVSIYRISFCTADKYHNQVFAFMARNSINETMECHAFYCAKQKIAQAVTLSVSQAFQLAKDKWENANNKKNSTKQQNNKEQKQLNTENALINTPSPIRQIQSAPQIDLLKDIHPRLPKPESTMSLVSQTRSDSPQQRVGWQTFDEEKSTSAVTFNNDADVEPESLDDWFSQLAEDRSRKQSYPSFSTDLCKEDLDDSVQDYMDGTKSLEAFSRTKSVEDLFNI